MKGLTQALFLAKARQAHGDRFDYSRAVFRRLNSEVEIGLPDGRYVMQRAISHLQGKVPFAIKGAVISKALSAGNDEAFLTKARVVHGNRYDYSRVQYLEMKKPVEIVCKTHGSFFQAPVVHLQSNCPACSNEKRARKKVEAYASLFEAQAFAVHGAQYDYSKAVYTGVKDKVIITCLKHGDFTQTPDGHLRGLGCCKCGYTASRDPKPNRELAAFIESLGFTVERESRLPGSQKRIDVLVPELKLAIEYQGLFWHSSGAPAVRSNPLAVANRHLQKRLECEAADLRYVAIYEDEWLTRRPLVESYLRMLCGKSARLYARSLALELVPSKEARAFYETHHFLGAGAAKGVHVGLRYAGTLVACMSAGRCSEQRGSVDAGLWSLSRFCTDGRVIAGGASRLFKRLKTEAVQAGAMQMVSYIDRDKFTGGVYKTLGFSEPVGVASDYWTIQAGERRHKTATKRSALAKRDDFRPGESEFENTQRMGLFRIYHSGRARVSQMLRERGCRFDA